MSRSAIAATVLLSALLAGCASTPTPVQNQKASDTPTTADSTTASPTPKSVPKAAKSSNACKDAKGDAEISDRASAAVDAINDLTSVTLKRNGDTLDVTWTVVEVDTDPGTAGFYLNLASEDENASGQLGVKYLDGRQIGYFTFSGSTNKNISGEAEVTPTSVTGSFPMSDLAQFGPNFKWGAATTREGNVDACPAADKLQFAG